MESFVGSAGLSRRVECGVNMRLKNRFAPVMVLACFMAASLIVIPPSYAHFTLGDYTPTFRFHASDFDPHVPGPLAYVWPGSGLASFTGTPNGFPVGYQTPYPGGNPPGQPSSIYQLESNAYAPFGAILTSTNDHATRGPLIFGLNFSRPCELAGVTCEGGKVVVGGSELFNYTGITIYVPPEFDLSSPRGNSGFISSTFSATAGDFAISRSRVQDPIGPGWWVLHAEGNIQFWPQHNYAEWYYIRVNDVLAPKIAGKYFFKVFLWDNNQMDVPGGWNTHSQIAGDAVQIPMSGPTALTVPMENWPVVLVKGELDPGIVTGTIRYGTFNATLYGLPINLPGRVRLVGVANDPYTGQATGRPVEARGYFNASALGHFEVEGVAPGKYLAFASAAGYPDQLIESSLTILPGQSLHLDGYLNPGVIVGGQIFSKHVFGQEPWPTDPRPIWVQIFKSNDYTDANLVAWSPWNKTHAPYMTYDWPQGSSIPEPLPVAYPWDAVTPDQLSYYTKTFQPPTTGPWISHASLTCGSSPSPSRNADPCGKPDGVGPAQYWWVDGSGAFTNGGGSDSFIFQFGVKGVFGAPSEVDGHIPQPYATWVNGLTAGRYWVRAYVNGYVQTLLDGATLAEYSFDVAKEEWAGDVFIPIDLRVGSTIVKTVHFHDQQDTLVDCPINGCVNSLAPGRSAGSRYLIAEIRDSSGKLSGLNFTLVQGTASSATIQINGFGMMGPDPNNGNMKFSYYRYQPSYRDYGVLAGTYKVYVYMRGYVPDDHEFVSVTLSGNPTLISDHLYRAARFNIVVYSLDWEHPNTQQTWEFPGAPLNVYALSGIRGITSLSFSQPARSGGNNIGGGCSLASSEIPDHCHIIGWDGASSGNPDGEATGGYVPYDQVYFTGGFLVYPSAYRLSNLNATGVFDTGTYSFIAYSYGYGQFGTYNAYAQRGGFGDIRINLLKGVNITINIPFKKEGILTPTEFNMSMRVRIFDDQGRVVATAETKTPGPSHYNDAQPLGIGRASTSGGTYYVDPFATSPSAANGLTTIDGSDNTADTFLWYGTWNGVTGWQAFDSDPDHDGVPDFSWYNNNNKGYTTWIPAGTQQVRVFIAGIYDTGDPLHGTPVLKPVPERIFQTSGINGSSGTIINSYQGGWTVEVDTWNEYPAPKFDQSTGMPLSTNWYPPAPPNIEGILEGDSFHTIPGSSEGPYGYVKDRLAKNGFGPYGQQGVWAIPNAPMDSETSAIYELDKRGYLSGSILGFIWSNELRTQSWVTIQASLTQGGPAYTHWSWDAMFDMYLPAGQYALSVITWTPNGNQGYRTVNSTISVSDGQSANGVLFQLERSNIPIPEFPAVGTIAILAAIAETILLHRGQRWTRGQRIQK